MSLDRRWQPLAPVLGEVWTVMQEQARDKGIAIAMTIDPAVPDEVRIDAIRMKQILLNVVGNALKFTKVGRIDLRVTMKNDAPRCRRLLKIEVEDTGCGIPFDVQSQLFQPFGQAGVDRSGAGLGLCLSRQLAVTSGGDLVLSRSGPGQGSLFTVTVDSGHLETSTLAETGHPVPVPSTRTGESLH